MCSATAAMLLLLLLLVPAPSAGQHCLAEMDKLGSDLRAEVAVMIEQGRAKAQEAVEVMEAKLEGRIPGWRRWMP